MPQVRGVFGRKSLDDVIPGSWYIIPLPTIREVVIGSNPSGSFYPCEDFRGDCLFVCCAERVYTNLAIAEKRLGRVDT